MIKHEIRVKYLRVLATLLVVFGHSIIFYTYSWNLMPIGYKSEVLNCIKSYINTIQMPIFVLISGYLFYYTLNKNKYNKLLDLLKDKGKRLLLPYVFICLCLIIPIRFFVHYSEYIDKGIFKVLIQDFIMVKDMGHAWFLIMLFNMFVLMYLFKKYLNKNIILNLILFSIMFYLSTKINNAFAVKSTLYYSIFFYTGYILNLYKDKIKDINKIKYPLLAINFVLWICMYKLEIRGSIGVLITLIISYAGALGIWLSFAKLVNSNRLVNYLDKRSFAIYLIHEPVGYLVFYYINGLAFPILLTSLIIFVISILVSILVYELLHKIKIQFLIGE